MSSEAASTPHLDAPIWSPETQTALDGLRTAELVMHKELVRVFHRVDLLIACGIGDMLIFLVGPPGVGKDAVLRMLVKTAAERRAVQPHLLSAVVVEMIAPEGPRLNWKDQLRDANRALHEAIPKKLDVSTFKTDARLLLQPRRTPNSGDLRSSYESTLRNRQPFFAAFNEAELLAEIPSGTSLESQLDVIKGLANRTGVPHLLVGNQKLLDFYAANPQEARRCRWVYFDRYEGPDGVPDFAAAVKAIAMQAKAPNVQQLLDNLDYLMDCSAGAVGIFKDWTVLATGNARNGGAEGPSIEDFEAMMLHDPATIDRDARDGKELFDHLEATRRPNVAARLAQPAEGRGLIGASERDRRWAERNQKRYRSASASRTTSEPKPKAKPGQPTPNRHRGKRLTA